MAAPSTAAAPPSWPPPLSPRQNLNLDPNKVWSFSGHPEDPATWNELLMIPISPQYVASPTWDVQSYFFNALNGRAPPEWTSAKEFILQIAQRSDVWVEMTLAAKTTIDPLTFGTPEPERFVQIQRCAQSLMLTRCASHGAATDALSEDEDETVPQGTSLPLDHPSLQPLQQKIQRILAYQQQMDYQFQIDLARKTHLEQEALQKGQERDAKARPSAIPGSREAQDGRKTSQGKIRGGN